MKTDMTIFTAEKARKMSLSRAQVVIKEDIANSIAEAISLGHRSCISLSLVDSPEIQELLKELGYTLAKLDSNPKVITIEW